MRSLPLALCALFVLAACGPSIKPAMQAATDARLASFGAGSGAPAPSSYDPPEWKPGQWMAYRIVEKDKPPTVVVMKVLEDAEGLWLETESQDYYGHTVTKVLYARMPKDPQDAVDALLKVVTKANDEEAQVMDFTADNPFASMMKATMKGYTANVTAPADVLNLPKESVTVAAGTFEGAAKFQGSYSFGPISRTVTGWYHPAVPLNGSVKTVTDDGTVTTELLAFGYDGATSALK